MTQDVLAWLLLLSRIAAMMVGCPLLAHAQVPRLWKAGMAAALAFLLAPLVSLPEPGVLRPEVGVLLPLVVQETILGYALGWLSCLSLQLVASVGGLIDLQSGLANASLLDPVRGEHQSLFTSMMNTVASLLFLQANAPALLVQAVMLSFRLFPLGGTHWVVAPLMAGVLPLGTWFFVQLMGLAMPWVLSFWALDLVTGFLGRLLPQLNLLSAGPPLKVMLAWWLTIQYFHQWLHRFESLHERFWRGGPW